MDPLTAIGFAAALVQFIELGCKITKRLVDFSNNLDQLPKAFRRVGTELPLIIDGVRRIQQQVKNDDISPSSQEALLPVLRECHDAAQRLEALLENVLPSASASSWERKKKAFLSLAHDGKVEEIAETLGKYVSVLTFHQVIRSSAPDREPIPDQPSIWWLVPFDRNAAFVGRDGIFNVIDKLLKVGEGSQPKAAMCGLGGIGKSQIAIEYCYRQRQSGIPCSVFWVNAVTSSRFEESFRRIARECGLISRDDSSTDAISLVQDWLQTRYKNPWLMVVDNADDEASFFHEKMHNGKTPSQSVPHCSHGSLIFTTRTRDMGVDLAAPAAPVMIPAFSQEEGVQLVHERLQDHCPSAELVLDLLEELEYIPLAITQAVAFILKRGKTIPQYLKLYQKNDSNRTRMLAFEFADHGRQAASMESVAKTWSVSFDWLRNNNVPAADLLCLISFFQHNGIPQRLLRGAASIEDDDSEDDELDFEDAVAALRAFSFVDVTDADVGTETVFRTHRLVQLATRWWLQSEGAAETTKWALAALRSVSRHFPPPTSVPFEDYWRTCQALSPHAELVLEYEFDGPYRRDGDIERARLLLHTGYYLAWVGDYGKAQERSEESMSLREKHLGQGAVETLESMGLLAGFLGMQSEYMGNAARAISLGEHVVALLTEIIGPDDPRTIDAMSNLGRALLTAERYDESESLQREAVARSTRVRGRHDLETLNCVSQLSVVLVGQGSDKKKIAEGIALQRELCEQKVKRLGDRHPDVLIDQHNLATMLELDRRNREEVLVLRRNTVLAMENVLGIDHCDTLVGVCDLILSLQKAQAHDQALALIDGTLAKCEKGPRKDNPISAAWVQKILSLRERSE
ncbi:short-chain dehydrogenase [Podospora aff. communis PSN243]|uniref:Short-chain dehydrogenase n=1 Tax=Podospora aff. communis PSN243 TaxID=3040156 RepID=A0AAV9G5J7_9PEZI|nr:short-chain dehydrogenase [Podospora aff. communis PSN243]